jgi:hypothetical protein
MPCPILSLTRFIPFILFTCCCRAIPHHRKPQCSYIGVSITAVAKLTCSAQALYPQLRVAVRSQAGMDNRCFKKSPPAVIILFIYYFITSLENDFLSNLRTF